LKKNYKRSHAGGISSTYSRGKKMKNLIRSAALAIAVLSLVVPDAAQAQATASAIAKSTVKKAVKNNNEARWLTMLTTMAVLSHEGTEVKRINAAEKKQIDDTITKVRQQITAAKSSGGISEAEEDQIDNAIADEMAKIALAWSDEPLKKANPIAPHATFKPQPATAQQQAAHAQTRGILLGLQKK